MFDGGNFRQGSSASRTRPHGNLRVLRVAVLLMFAILVARLVNMQIVHGEDYARRSRDNYISETNILPPRGLIYDRNGQPLVRNIGIYNAVITPRFLPESSKARDQMYLWIESALGVPALQVQALVQDAEDGDRMDAPITVKRYLSADEALTLDEAATNMPGLSLSITPGREYIGGNAFSHILGYIGLQDPGQVAELRRQGYAFNEPIGKAGVESRYESDLRGKIGFASNEQDAYGNLISVLESTEAQPGKSLRLSIDSGLQNYIAELLQDAMGEAYTAAAVVMDAKTGELYSLVSIPTYDNNMYSKPDLYAEELERMVKDDVRKPFLNKALTAEAPGSTFKLITAAAALSEGLVTPETGRQVDSRILPIKGENGETYLLYDWATHGWVNLTRGIARSSNIYFYMASCGIYPETPGLGKDPYESAITLAHYARMFGLGKSTGLDVNSGEMAGVVPDPEYKKRAYSGPEFNPWDREWYYADTCFMGIGQQDVKASPLQIARMTASIANGGNLLTPHVVSEVLDVEGNVVRTTEVEAKKIDVAEQHLAAIRQGMWESVNSSDGAGRRAQMPGLAIAGKTGTAEFRRQDGVWDEHAWFTGYMPANDPKYVVTVYFDRGVGGDKAAPIAGLIMQYIAENLAQ